MSNQHFVHNPEITGTTDGSVIQGQVLHKNIHPWMLAERLIIIFLTDTTKISNAFTFPCLKVLHLYF